MTYKKSHIDRGFLTAVLLLLGFGVLVLAGISANYSYKQFGNTTFFLFHQLKSGILIGVILGFIAYKINLDIYKKLSLFLLILGFILMAIVFIPGLGISSGGASRWVGFKSFSFQPSEFFKLFFIIYIANWLSGKTQEKRRSLLPFLLILGISAVSLSLQKDLGTLAIIIFIALTCYFSAKTPLWHTIVLLLSSLSLGVFMIKISSYRVERIRIWLDSILGRKTLDQDLMGIGYQIKKAVMLIGSGGIFGVGLGKGSSQTVPHPISDSIFTHIGEEIGFLGCFLLIAFFAFFLWRGIKIAKNSEDGFSKIFAIGFSSWIFFQAFLNMAALTELLPLTGIPLPFISYGGSHVIAELIGVGIMLNISKEIKK